MLRFAGYALWAAAAGALIPFMAILNGRLGRTLGDPLLAPVLLFAVGFMVALTVGLIATGQVPDLRLALRARPIDFAGGAIVAGYVISVTLLAPRFGIGNAILFVMTAQIFTSALIDHFGLLGAVSRPVTTPRLIGLAIMVLGLALSQYTPSRAMRATAEIGQSG
ncbi:MAG: DMT family transporter [Alphaproteobacteria bacterium]|nr:DMT family transporter [Alphaproteobacteria bacterium]